MHHHVEEFAAALQRAQQVEGVGALDLEVGEAVAAGVGGGARHRRFALVDRQHLAGARLARERQGEPAVVAEGVETARAAGASAASAAWLST